MEAAWSLDIPISSDIHCSQMLTSRIARRALDLLLKDIHRQSDHPQHNNNKMVELLRWSRGCRKHNLAKYRDIPLLLRWRISKLT